MPTTMKLSIVCVYMYALLSQVFIYRFTAHIFQSIRSSSYACLHIYTYIYHIYAISLGVISIIMHLLLPRLIFDFNALFTN